MQNEITQKEHETVRAFAQEQQGRDSGEYQDKQASRADHLGGLAHNYNKAMEEWSQRSPTGAAAFKTVADFFAADKLAEGLDPSTAKSKTTGQLVADSFAVSSSVATVAMGGTEKLAEKAGSALEYKIMATSESLAGKYGAQTAKDTAEVMEILIKDRSPQVVEHLVGKISKFTAKEQHECNELMKAAIEKVVPDEAAKKAMEKVFDAATEQAEHDREAREKTNDHVLAQKVHDSNGHVRSGKIVGVYPSAKDPEVLVMHTSNDQYISFKPEEWKGKDGKGGAAPNLGSYATAGGGQMTDLDQSVKAEIGLVNEHYGKHIQAPKDGKVELYESAHPPRGKSETAIVCGDAVFLEKPGGNGQFMFARTSDLGVKPGDPGLKSGDVVNFNARGEVSITPAEQAQQRATPNARQPDFVR